MALFPTRIHGGGDGDRFTGRQYDVTHDGRFLINTVLPRTHAISELITMLAELGFDIPADEQEASVLTDYAVAACYPGPS